MNARLDRMDGRMDRMDARLDRVEDITSATREDIADSRERLRRLETLIEQGLHQPNTAVTRTCAWAVFPNPPGFSRLEHFRIELHQ